MSKKHDNLKTNIVTDVSKHFDNSVGKIISQVKKTQEQAQIQYINNQMFDSQQIIEQHQIKINTLEQEKRDKYEIFNSESSSTTVPRDVVQIKDTLNNNEEEHNISHQISTNIISEQKTTRETISSETLLTPDVVIGFYNFSSQIKEYEEKFGISVLHTKELLLQQKKLGRK